MFNSITLQEVIEAMDAGEVFSVGFRTCNLKKGTGGEWLQFDQVKKYMAKTRSEMYAESHKPNINRKDPKHYENSTRNLVIMQSGEIVKIHLRLIRLFNSKTVL